MENNLTIDEEYNLQNDILDTTLESLDITLDLNKQIEENNKRIYKQDEITYQDVITSQENFYYSLGKLRINKEQINYSFENEKSNLGKLLVSNEGIKEVIDKIIEMAKKIWEKIAHFFKRLWSKILVFWMGVAKRWNSVRKELLSLREKNTVPVPVKHVVKLANEFQFYLPKGKLEIENVVLAQIEIATQLTELGRKQGIWDKFVNVVSGNTVLDKALKNTPTISKLTKLQPDIINNGIVTYAYKDTVKYLYEAEGVIKYDVIKLNNEYKESDFSSMTKTIEGIKEPVIVFDTDTMLKIANGIDSLYNNIRVIDKSVSAVQNNFDKEVKKLRSKEDKNSPEISQGLKNALLISSKYPLDAIYSCIYNIRGLSNILQKLIKKSIWSDPYKLYQYYYDRGFKDDFDLVKKGDKVYLKPTSESSIKTARLCGGGYVIPVNIQGDKYKNKIKDMVGIENSGVCFIVIDPEMDMAKEHFDFVYYHELGHCVTGQFETKFKIAQDCLQYIDNPGENKADAYACLKIGMSIDKLWEFRYRTFLESIQEEFNMSKEQAKEILKPWILRKEEFKHNIKKHMDEFREYVKLGLVGYIRSKLY